MPRPIQRAPRTVEWLVNEAPAVISPAALAEILGRNENALRNAAKNGQVPGAYRLGKRWVIPRTAALEMAGVAVPA